MSPRPVVSPLPGKSSRGMSNSVRGAVLVLGFAILWLFTPPALSLCGFRRLSGHLCPLCGLTHAMFALAKGRVGEAIHCHALSPLALFLLAGTLWNAPRMARLWGPCIAAFGAYGLWRLIS